MRLQGGNTRVGVISRLAWGVLIIFVLSLFPTDAVGNDEGLHTVVVVGGEAAKAEAPSAERPKNDIAARMARESAAGLLAEQFEPEPVKSAEPMASPEKMEDAVAASATRAAETNSPRTEAKTAVAEVHSSAADAAEAPSAAKPMFGPGIGGSAKDGAAAPASTWYVMFRVTLVMLLLVGGLVGALYAVKRFGQRLVGHEPSAGMKVLSRLQLDARNSLVLVGLYEDEILVGCGPNGVVMLNKYAAIDHAAGEPADSRSAAESAARLSQLPAGLAPAAAFEVEEDDADDAPPVKSFPGDARPQTLVRGPTTISELLKSRGVKR